MSLTKKAPNWLINFSDIEHYYPIASKFLHIKNNYSIMQQFGVEPPVGPFFEGTLFNLSPVHPKKQSEKRIPGVMHEANADDLNGVRIIRSAQVISLKSNGGSSQKITQCVYKKDGKTKTLDADNFILCMGGLENSRFLLLECERNKTYVSKVKDNIGKYFTEHPHPHMGDIFLDKKFMPFSESVLSSNKKYVAKVKFTLFERTRIKGPPLSHTLAIIKKSNSKKAYLASINEQLPLESNRIELSNKLGMDGHPLLKLHYEVDKISRKRIYDASILFARYLGVNSDSRVKLNLNTDTIQSQSFLGGGHHHMGGTCMGLLEYGGVVDKDCRVYGVDNLFIAGSSVFPRGDSVNPTLNAIALGLYAVDKMRS